MYELKLEVIKVTCVLEEKKRRKLLFTLVVALRSLIYKRTWKQKV